MSVIITDKGSKSVVNKPKKEKTTKKDKEE